MNFIKTMFSGGAAGGAERAELHDCVRRIFGDEFTLKDSVDSARQRSRYVGHVASILPQVLDSRTSPHQNSWLRSGSRKLTTSSDSASLDPFRNDERAGRLGPKSVVFDSTTGNGRSILVGDERVSVQGLSNFATIRASVCVHSGKWMYEAHLGSKGIMQIGWCTAGCRFSIDAGVGDTPNSYAYDGARVRKWNLATMQYGEQWMSGDVVGTCIDLDNGTIKYYRNGRDLGVAFASVCRGPGLAYFPAVSLAAQERVYANFGHVPFVFPVAEYEALQLPPARECARARLLFNSLEAVCEEILYGAARKPKKTSPSKDSQQDGVLDKSSTSMPAPPAPRAPSDTGPPPVATAEQEDLDMSHRAFLISLARVIWDEVWPALAHGAYVAVAELLPRLRALAGADDDEVSAPAPRRYGATPPDAGYEHYEKEHFVDLRAQLKSRPPRMLNLFLDLMWSFLDEVTACDIIEHCSVRECFLYDLVSGDLKYERQMRCVYFMCSLMQHTLTRHNMVKYVLFGKVSFDNFLHVRQADETALSARLTTSWWPRTRAAPPAVQDTEDVAFQAMRSEEDLNMERDYYKECSKLAEALAPLEQLQVEYLKILLDNSDGTNAIPSTRKIFLGKFRKYVMDNCILDMRLFHVSRTSPAIALCAFHRMLTTLLQLWRQEAPDLPFALPSRSFYDGTQDFFNVDRIGGVMPYLVRTHREELIEALGENHPYLASFEPTYNRAGGIDMGVDNDLTLVPPAGMATLPQVISSIARFMTNANNANSNAFPRLGGDTSVAMKDARSVMPGAGCADPNLSLYRLLDGLLALYHFIACKQMEKINEIRDNQVDFVDCLFDVECRLGAVQHELELINMEIEDDEGSNPSRNLMESILKQLTSAKEVYEKRLQWTSLQIWWALATSWTRGRQRDVALLLRAALGTLRDATEPGHLLRMQVPSREVLGGRNCLLKTNLISYASLDLEYSSPSSQSTVNGDAALRGKSPGSFDAARVTNVPADDQLAHGGAVANAGVDLDAAVSDMLLEHRLEPEAAGPSSADHQVPSPKLFSFVPEYYIEATIELCNTIRLYMHPTVNMNQLEGWDNLNVEMASFLCRHFNDPRIVLASTKDALIQTLASFATQRDTMRAIERVPEEIQMLMVEELLKPYQNRAWAQTNWVLVRFWHGSGFGYRHRQWPHLAARYGDREPTYANFGTKVDAGLMSQCFGPCPSELIQFRVKSYLERNPDKATAFLNSLLTQINWAFSEFANLIQEMDTVRANERIEPRQIKVAMTCFDLYHGLARALEMTLRLNPRMLIDPAASDNSDDLLLTRTCGTVCAALTRVVGDRAGGAAFSRAAASCLPGADRLHHYVALAPLTGCILNMVRDEVGSPEVGKVTSALLAEPLFSADCFDFMMGRGNAGAFSFADYPADVTRGELAELEAAGRHLAKWASRVSPVASSGHSSEGRGRPLCPICCAREMNAVFVPCGHRSCRSCIRQHLLNSKQCFFCKAIIESTKEASDTSLSPELVAAGAN